MTLFKTPENRIVQDPRWLQPLSSPPGGKPQGREPYLNRMATLLSDVFTTGKGRNLFVLGKPGTGKTVCIRYLLQELQRHAEQENIPLAAVYVNAGKTRTPYYTLLKIVQGLGVDVPPSGWQMFRLKHAFEDVTKERPVVVAIDEVATLLLKEKEPLVYYLNRQPHTTLILVSNKIEDAADLPDSALSTLQPQPIGLTPYTPDEAKAILRERVRNALHPQALSDHLLEIVAEFAAKAEDIRLGFSIIRQAAHTAEQHGRRTIHPDDVKTAFKSETRLIQLRDILENQSAIEQLRRRR